MRSPPFVQAAVSSKWVLLAPRPPSPLPNWSTKPSHCVARGGRPGDLEAVIDLIAKGDLSIQATTTDFDGIPEAIERLKHGDVVGRIVAVMD